MSPGNGPDEDALSAHRPYLLRFARRRLSDAALAEDVVQETLLAALRGAGRFEHKASLSTWLTAILLNRIGDTLRRRRDEPSPVEAPSDAGDGAATTHEPVDWHDPARLLEGRQSVARLGSCFDTLPALPARALVLREIDGLSHEEIARALGVSSAYVAVLLHRARGRLRNCLDGFN